MIVGQRGTWMLAEFTVRDITKHQAYRERPYLAVVDKDEGRTNNGSCYLIGDYLGASIRIHSFIPS